VMIVIFKKFTTLKDTCFTSPALEQEIICGSVA
jgi:hypothetical protein